MSQTDINNQTNQLNNQKLALLGVGSVLLCLSLLMSVFTPYPLILSIVLFGRAKGYMAAAICSMAVYGIGLFLFKDLFFFAFYICSALLAIAIGEIVLRKLPPVKALVALGLGINALILGIVYLSSVSQGITIKEMIVREIKYNEAAFEQVKDKIGASGTLSKESIEVLSVLNEPELLATQFMESAPSYLFIGVFFLLWVNMFLILNAKNYLGDKLTGFSERELVSFKVPEQFIWVVIASLIGAIWGEDLGAKWLEPIGLTVLKCLGVFYFFQGFGIYLDFLSYARIKGFFRTFLIVITVFSANQVVAVLGLFDMFINFRRFFKKN